MTRVTFNGGNYRGILHFNSWVDAVKWCGSTGLTQLRNAAPSNDTKVLEYVNESHSMHARVEDEVIPRGRQENRPWFVAGDDIYRGQIVTLDADGSLVLANPAVTLEDMEAYWNQRESFIEEDY